MRAVRVRLVSVVAASGIAVAALVGAGSGSLAGPPSASWAAVEGWYEHVGAAAAALVGLRIVALVSAAWLLAASGLQLLAGLSPGGAVQQVADALSPLVLRRLSHGVAGVSVTIALAGPPAPPDDPAGTAVMEVLDDAASPTTSPPTTLPPTTQPPVGEPPPPSPDEEVVVAPGDSFWSLAVDVVGDGARPVAIDDYWRRLIALNRGRLVDPGNPDLLYPGQVLLLPPLGG